MEDFNSPDFKNWIKEKNFTVSLSTIEGDLVAIWSQMGSTKAPNGMSLTPCYKCLTSQANLLNPSNTQLGINRNICTYLTNLKERFSLDSSPSIGLIKVWIKDQLSKFGFSSKYSEANYSILPSPLWSLSKYFNNINLMHQRICYLVYLFHCFDLNLTPLHWSQLATSNGLAIKIFRFNIENHVNHATHQKQLKIGLKQKTLSLFVRELTPEDFIDPLIATLCHE